MDLDARTLVWANIVVAFAVAAVTYSFWSAQPAVRGLRGWSVGLVICGLGWLALMLRSMPPTAVMSIVPSALVAAGYSVIWLSVRRFNESRFDLRHVALSVLLFAAIFTGVWLGGAHTRDRVAIVTFLVGVLALLAGWEIIKRNRTEPLRGRWPTALAFALLGATMITRSGLSLRNALLTVEPELEDPTRGVALFITTIWMVGVTLGLLLMSNERLRQRYARLALTDELTELPNRRFFLEHGERHSRRALRDGIPACVLMMDLDHFSDINERYGHAGGDQALIAFADLLRRSLRPADLAARYGGEEFSAFLSGATPNEGASIAERIRVALSEQKIEVRGQKIKVTISIGVAPLHDGDLRDTIRIADEALYRAKSWGRNQVALSPADGTSTAALSSGRRAG